jgi:hypothetical protein
MDLSTCLHSTSELSKPVSHLGLQGFRLSSSDGLYRSLLWSGMVIRLPPCEQRYCQAIGDLRPADAGSCGLVGEHAQFGVQFLPLEFLPG